MKRQFFLAFTILTITVLLSGLTYSQSDPPSNLMATVAGKSLTLTWEASGNNQKTTYNIYRATVENANEAADPMKLNFSKVGTVTTTTFDDKTAGPGQVYVYYVVSVNKDGVESAGSNYVNVTIGEKDAGTDQY